MRKLHSSGLVKWVIMGVILSIVILGIVLILFTSDYNNRAQICPSVSQFSGTYLPKYPDETMQSLVDIVEKGTRTFMKPTSSMRFDEDHICVLTEYPVISGSSVQYYTSNVVWNLHNENDASKPDCEVWLKLPDRNLQLYIYNNKPPYEIRQQEPVNGFDCCFFVQAIKQ